MLDDLELAALMKRVQAGDADAYAVLLNDLVPRLRGRIHSRRALLGPDATDDVVQDILVSMHAARATYDPQRPFWPWLLAIARHRLADAAQRQARRNAHEIIVEEIDVTFSGERPNFLMDGYSDAQALKQAVRALPDGQRVAIELLKLRGLSLKEAAEASGTSIGALKVATHRAMSALRKMLRA